MPIFNQLDYGKAINQGNVNALNQANLINTADTMRQRNVLAPMEQEKAALGRDAAKMDLMIKGTKYIKATAPRITDQSTYDAIKFDWEEKGLTNPGELPDKWTPELSRQLAGGAQKQLEKFGAAEPIPGMEGYAGQRSLDTGKYANVQKVSRETEPKELTLTPGQKKVDETFAKDYTGYVAAGGYADINKQLGQLNEVHTQLKKAAGLMKLEKGEERPSLTGPWMSTMPDAVLSRINPDAMAARDAVEEVVQRNLRLVLGAQFTEKEGERLIARAYNPRLGEKENAMRVGRLIGQIRQASKAKQRASDYYEKNGTLKGFKGRLWTMSDFSPDGKKEMAVTDLVNKYAD